MNHFPEFNIDRLKDSARNWKDILERRNVTILRITLYHYRGGYRRGIPMAAYFSERFRGKDGPYISPLKYAVVFTLNCPGKAPEPVEHAMCLHKNINSFIAQDTSHMAARHMDIPTFAMDGIREGYKTDIPANFTDEWLFLPYCSGPGCEGISLSPGLKIDKKFAVLYENVAHLTVQEKLKQDAPEKTSRTLIKSWGPEDLFPIDRMSKERELAIWNEWIQPIVDHHYNGVLEYKYCTEPKKISYDEFEKVWEQCVAPFICSCIPTGIKIPPSVTQTETEDLISCNIWEPDLFVLEYLLPLKAGKGAEFVDSFLKCLISIIDGGDLPSFLAYIDQVSGEEYVVLSLSRNAEQQEKQNSIAGQAETQADRLDKVVEHIRLIGCGNITNQEVIQLLEKKDIHYDYPEMFKDMRKAMVSELRKKGISNRIIALILEWRRIQNKKVKIESVIRQLPR